MAPDILDRPEAVRPGEEIDAVRIGSFLSRVSPSLQGAPEISQFPGGASNLTYLLHYPDRDLVLRRPPFGRYAAGAHDVLREARIMQAIKPVYPYAPEVLALNEGDEVMDAPFFVMARIPGIILRSKLPQGFDLSRAEARRLCLSVIDRLIELHQVDVAASGLMQIGKGDGYVRRQVESWSVRCRKAATEDVGDFEEVMAWLAAKMPPRESGGCVIHNDYRFDNVVLDAHDPFKVVGVLDWELATLGDPLMDLGGSLAYWIEADDPPELTGLRLQPTNLPGMLTRREVIDYYCERAGHHVGSFDFYRVFGLFRLAVIAKQIYFRFVQGQTLNPRFASFGKAVNGLETCCRDLIAKSDL
jgi:aminoglycoside phosphotransferase (APT) family kinase protein